jgi:glycosyltransferase involved in cell wall biosynthesis
MGTRAYERGKVQMLPSVLIATMGGGRLEEVVRTYLRDRAAAVEVVVIVDNPSINREAFLLSLRSDARLTLAFNEVNMGLTKSLNKGLDLCHGDIVLRNDDDDLPHPERLAKTVAYFREHPDCDLAYTFTRGIDGNSGRTWTIRGPTSDPEIKARLLRRNIIAHSSLALRRERLKALGGYDATFRYAQDYDLYLRCIRAAWRFGCIPEVLVERHYHHDSITVKLRRMQILYSFAARLIHDAEVGAGNRYWRTILHYLQLLAIPNILRAVRRRAGFGR